MGNHLSDITTCVPNCENIIVHFDKGDVLVAHNQYELLHMLIYPVYFAPPTPAEMMHLGMAPLSICELLSYGYCPESCLCSLNKAATANYNGFFGTRYDENGKYDPVNYHFHELGSKSMKRARDAEWRLVIEADLREMLNELTARTISMRDKC